MRAMLAPFCRMIGQVCVCACVSSRWTPLPARMTGGRVRPVSIGLTRFLLAPSCCMVGVSHCLERVFPNFEFGERFPQQNAGLSRCGGTRDFCCFSSSVHSRGVIGRISVSARSLRVLRIGLYVQIRAGEFPLVRVQGVLRRSVQVARCLVRARSHLLSATMETRCNSLAIGSSGV